MPRAVVVHLEPAEAAGIAERLRRGGFDADACPARGTGGLSAIRENPPDAVVIDLVRMPSYGRWVGALLREHKSTRMIPLVFVGGDPQKVRLVRKLLPDAAFTSLPRLGAALEKAIRKPPRNPVRPDPTRIPLAGKMRIQEGSTIALINAPRGFRSKLEPLPRGVRFQPEAGVADLILLFVRSTAQLSRKLPVVARELLFKRTVWVLWPKKASGISSDLSLPGIIESCSALGLASRK